MKTKKLLAVILALSMCFVLIAACADPAPAPEAAPAPDAAPAPEEAAPAPDAAPAPEAPQEEAPAAGGVADDPHVTLTYAEVNPIDTLVGATGAEFKRLVEELSGGSISINFQPGGVLGHEGDILDGMMGGAGMVDISRISVFALSPYGTQLLPLLTVPFTFSSPDHFWAFADSDLAQRFLSEPYDLGLGLRGLFFFQEGFRHFFMVNEVSDMSDLAGTTLRVSTDPVMVQMVESLGATAAVIDFTELYSALAAGVVDGAEQPTINYHSNRFHEVAPYLIESAHTLGALTAVITDDAWYSLTPAQQDVIMEASRLSSEFARYEFEAREQAAIDLLLEEGATIVPVADMQPLREGAADLISSLIVGFEAEYEAILGFDN